MHLKSSVPDQVPCATTLCVVNLNATEARVEAMAQQYIQLRPLGALGPPGEDDADDNYFMYDDDDNYQYEVSPCTDLLYLIKPAVVCHLEAE